MALTDDYSNRIMIFEDGKPVKNEGLYSMLKISLTTSRNDTIVSNSLINSIFTSIKDPFTGYTYMTPSKVFEDFCRINELTFRFDNEIGDYIVKAKA